MLFTKLYRNALRQLLTPADTTLLRFIPGKLNNVAPGDMATVRTHE